MPETFMTLGLVVITLLLVVLVFIVAHLAASLGATRRALIESGGLHRLAEQCNRLRCTLEELEKAVDARLDFLTHLARDEQAQRDIRETVEELRDLFRDMREDMRRSHHENRAAAEQLHEWMTSFLGETRAMQEAQGAVRRDTQLFLDQLTASAAELRDMRTGLSERSAAGDAEAPARADPGRITEPASPEITDLVHFAVSCPEVMAPGTPYVIDVWAFLESQRGHLEELVRGALRGAEPYMKTKGPRPIVRGGTLTIDLRVADLLPESMEDLVVWAGEIGNATFPISIPEGAEPKSYPGVATVRVMGQQIARLDFTVEVGAEVSAARLLAARIRRHRSAFASYSSTDRDEVLGRIQGMLKEAPGLDIFFDKASLRSGDDWKEQLCSEIHRRDILYLFWSPAACESPQVEWEWRYALEKKGIAAIDPVPLVPRDEALPPQELEHLHFDEWTLAYRRMKKSG